MNQNKSRASLIGIAGGYLIYLAYELMKNLIDDVPTTMPHWTAILAIVFFAVIGVVLLVYAYRIWKKGKEEQDGNSADDAGQDDAIK